MKDITLAALHTSYRISSLFGRYITRTHITPIIAQFANHPLVEVETLGMSENTVPIELITLGSGSKKLLFWSQMHGNESTTTKAILDCITMLLDTSNEISKTILANCKLYIVPILNPDGAQVYTRLNHNAVDLNRDAQELTQAESVLFNTLVEKVTPDFAFNLHGQRTLFSAGSTNKSATVSFLAPAGDAERSITPPRKIAMELIVCMNTVLQEYIPNQIGRYDDGFNSNCVGDALTILGIPTVLFEAGHYANDYPREETRKFIFYALVTALQHISRHTIDGSNYQDYFLIPENDKCFYDIIIRDVILANKTIDIALQYTETLHNDHIAFIPIIVNMGILDRFFGHKEFEGRQRKITHYQNTVDLKLGIEMLKFRLDDEVFSAEQTNN